MARVGFALLTVIAMLAACGGDDAAAPDIPSTTSPTTTAAPEPSAPSPTTSVDAVRGHVQAWYDDAHDATDPPSGVTGPSQVECDGRGEIDVGAVLVCRLVPQTEPDHPLETASLVVLVLDADGRSAWSGGTDLPASTADLLGLHTRARRAMACEDLLSGEAPHPFDAATTDRGNQFFWMLAYWTLEGRPAAMDPDGDGVPCEAFFEPGIVASVLAGGPVTPRTAPAAPATMTPGELAPGDVLVTGDVGVAVVRDGRVAGTVWTEPTRAAHHLRDGAGIVLDPVDPAADGTERLILVADDGTATALPGLTPGPRYRLFGTAWVSVEGELVGAETALVGEVSTDTDLASLVAVEIEHGRTHTVTLGPSYGDVTNVSYAAAGFVVSHITPDGADLLSFVDWHGQPDESAWPVRVAPGAFGHQRDGAHGLFVPTPTWELLVHVEPAAADPARTALVVTTFDGSDNTTDRPLEVIVADTDQYVTAVDAERERAVVSLADATSEEPLPARLVDLTTGTTVELPVAGRASLVALRPCSAWGLERPGPQAELPDATAATRDAILSAALACDYDRLDELTRTGTNEFSATDVSDYWEVPPGRFWAAAEAEGRDMLAGLVHDLSQPPELTEWFGVGPSYRWVDPERCGDYDGLALCRSADITPDGEWLGWLQESP